MTQVPPLFHHYSLMKSLGPEDWHCRRGGSFINTSLQHMSTKQEARKSDPISVHALAAFRDFDQFK